MLEAINGLKTELKENIQNEISNFKKIMDDQGEKNKKVLIDRKRRVDSAEENIEKSV